MKNIFKIVCAFLCLSNLAFSSSETPDQTAARFANTLRINIIPSLQAGTILEPQVQQFFMTEVFPSQVLSKQVTTDDGAFLRAAADSIGGGNCTQSAANGLLALQPADLATVKGAISNPNDASFDAYGVMMYKKGLWPADWLSPNAKAMLELK